MSNIIGIESTESKIEKLKESISGDFIFEDLKEEDKEEKVGPPANPELFGKILKFRYRKNKNDIKDRAIFLVENDNRYIKGFDAEKLTPQLLSTMFLTLKSLKYELGDKRLSLILMCSKNVLDEEIFIKHLEEEKAKDENYVKSIYFMYKKYIESTKAIMQAFRNFKIACIEEYYGDESIFKYYNIPEPKVANEEEVELEKKGE